jgi:hypothetical protein
MHTLRALVHPGVRGLLDAHLRRRLAALARFILDKLIKGAVGST